MSKLPDWSSTPGMLTESYIIRDHCRIHYWLGGSNKSEAPLIVMTHGATMDHLMLNAQVEALAPKYKVLVWDTRGHGKSRPLNKDFYLKDCADDLKAILNQIGVDEVIPISQSMGGYISQYFYLHYPLSVKAMVVIGSTSIALPYPRWQIIALKASVPVCNLWPYNHFIKSVVKNTALKPDVRKYVHETISKLDRPSFIQIWKAVTLAIDEVKDHKNGI